MKKPKTRWKVLFVSVVLIGLMCGAVWDVIHLNKLGHVTSNQWSNQLTKTFGEQDYVNLSEDKLTGEVVALSLGKALGRDRIAELTGNVPMTDDDYVNAVTDLGILTRGQLNTELTSQVASDALDKTVEIYFDESNYPEYFNVEYKDGVVDATANGGVYTTDQENVINLDSNYSDVNAGQVIVYNDSEGVTHSQVVDEISEKEDGSLEAVVSNVDDISSIVNTVSFSGVATVSHTGEYYNTDEYMMIDANENPTVVSSGDQGQGAAGVPEGYYEDYGDNNVYVAFDGESGAAGAVSISDLQVMVSGEINPENPDEVDSVKIDVSGDADVQLDSVEQTGVEYFAGSIVVPVEADGVTTNVVLDIYVKQDEEGNGTCVFNPHVEMYQVPLTDVEYQTNIAVTEPGLAATTSYFSDMTSLADAPDLLSGGIENAINNEVEKAKESIREQIERAIYQMIEDYINQMFAEALEGCE